MWNFHGVLVFGLGSSNGCNTIRIWTFQGLSDKFKNSKSLSQERMSLTPLFGFFLGYPNVQTYKVGS